MFDILTTLPKLSAIPIMNELYYILQYGNRGSTFGFRSNQLNEEEKIVFLGIVEKIDPKFSGRYIQELNNTFDKITGFTGIPKSEQKAISKDVLEATQERLPSSTILAESEPHIVSTKKADISTKAESSEREIVELVEGVQHGNRAAQYKLYQTYAQVLYGVCLRIVRDESLAEEVLQDVFVAVFTNIDRYNGNTKFFTWLLNIARNKAIDSLRREQKHAKSRPLLVNQDDDIAIVEPVEDSRLDTEQLRQAMEQLPSNYRAVLEMHLFEGYDYKEIAQTLRISVKEAIDQYKVSTKQLLQLVNIVS